MKKWHEGTLQQMEEYEVWADSIMHYPIVGKNALTGEPEPNKQLTTDESVNSRIEHPENGNYICKFKNNPSPILPRFTDAEVIAKGYDLGELE